MSRIPIFSFFLVAFVLAGCGSNPAWQRQTFAFDAPADTPASITGTNLVALGRLTVSPPFGSRSFTYRTGANTYTHDPYAEFMVSPDRALAEPIRLGLRKRGIFGRVLGQGSELTPTIIVEATIDELDGDFRDPSHQVAAMAIHFIVYRIGLDGPGPVVLDKVCARRVPMARRTPSALMDAWNAGLSQIMDEINSAYAKTNLNDR